MASVVEEKKSHMADIQQKFQGLYPPLPENITERKKALIIDFLIRLGLVMPMRLLGKICGSKYQLWWFRLFYGWFVSMMNDKGLGEHKTMKVTRARFSDVPVRVYEPKHRKGDGAIIYFHGGGFVVYPVGPYDYLARRICERTGLTLITVEYRLAPEHKYPAAVEDCERATVHFLTETYKNYSVNPQKTVIMGDSSGGNLAAVLQVLIYPCTQILNFKLPSIKLEERCEGTSLLSPSLMARSTLHYLIGEDISHYVPDLLNNKHITSEIRRSPAFDHVRWQHLPAAYHPDQSARQQDPSSEHSTPNMELYKRLRPYLLDPNVSPLLFPDLEGSPASMVITVDIDPMRDEGILFAERLRKAGVKVIHKNYPTGFHGMFSVPYHAKEIDQGIQDLAIFIHDKL